MFRLYPGSIRCAGPSLATGNPKFSLYHHHHHHHHHHHQSVLPKGRFFTASTGFWAVVLPKAGLPPHTQETRLQFYRGLNICGNFPLLSAPTLSLASKYTLKDLKRSQGHKRGGEWSGFGLTGPSGLHRNSP